MYRISKPRGKRGHYKPEKEFEITCDECGILTIAKRKTKRFCSLFCAQRKRSPLKGRKKGKFLPCKLCGKEVWVMPHRLKNKNIFCCKEHLYLYIKTNAKKILCRGCGTEIPLQSQRKTCSDICHKKWFTEFIEQRRIKTGLTKHQIDRSERYSVKAKHWRDEVFKRDNYTCIWCGIRSGKGVGEVRLEADHIKPWAFFPDLRYEVSNGRTLCRKCHDTTKMSYKKMREVYNIQ